jgi:hypothetical protein
MIRASKINIKIRLGVRLFCIIFKIMNIEKICFLKLYLIGLENFR